jgi:inner membrane protein
MDSLTHLFLGGAMAAAIAPSKYRRQALVAGAIINSLPDLDVIPLALFADDPLVNLTWHRGATHSLFVLAIAAVFLWWLLKSPWCARIHGAASGWFW